MITFRYHGYPYPDMGTCEIMRNIADGLFVYSQMADTFEPLLVDVISKSRYAVPCEVDGLIEVISTKNRERRYREMSKR